MRERNLVVKPLAIVLIGLFAVVVAGCGSDDETTSDAQTSATTQSDAQTTTSTGTGTDTTASSKETRESVDSAVADCEERADELGTIPGAALSAACQEVGDAVKRNLNDADENVDQALTDAAQSCRDLAGNIPAGSARDALDSLCQTISSER